MKITRITTSKYPDRVKRTALVDTDQLKYRAKDIYQKIEELNEAIDKKLNRITTRICDLFG